MAGCSVDDALASFHGAGCALDTPECLVAWDRSAFSEDDLAKLVRARLAEARAGRKIWTERRSYPGTVDHVKTPLVSGRRDAEAIAIRVRAMFVSDRKTIQQIAEIEGLPEAEIRRICRTEAQPRKPKLPIGSAQNRAVEKVQQSEAAQKAEREERLRAFYRLFGRQPPARVVGA